MARPIRNTPILTGLDATYFNQAASVIPNSASRRKERARLENSVNRFMDMLANLPQ